MSSRKATSRQWLLGLPPMAAFVLSPLYLHASGKELSQLSDEDVFAVLAVASIIWCLTLLGCLADEYCTCAPRFISGILVAQTLLIYGGMVVTSWTALREAHVNSFADLLPRGHHSLRTAKPPEAVAAAASTSEQASAVSQPEPSEQPWPKLLYDKGGELLWKDAGDGFCEDADTHDEFCSSHALGKTMQECSDIAASDASSLAFDFSRNDGGCDVRYAAGTLAIDIEGYEWYAWGAGKGNPGGSGQQKHNLPTRCYAKPQNKAAHIQSKTQDEHALSTQLHPYYHALIREYAFKPVRTERGKEVNIILVRAPPGDKEIELFDKYKDELLFIGISCLEDFPLPPTNPFSPKFPPDKFVGMFPGFLNMYHNPEHIYPSHVKTLDMSQSDFSLPALGQPMAKKYDFTFSGSDQDIGQAFESDCVGWSMHCKNWSFARQALEVMCGELGMTGVLVATKDKKDKNRCRIPKSCEGKIVQTTYLERQEDFFSYVRQSRFLFLPQVHDASPRVATQALALNVPLLMNRNLIGGWKYLNEKTGEFFHDLSDFRESVQRLLQNVEAGDVYEPRKWVTANYGDERSGKKFKDWIETNFHDRVKLPDGTRLLFSGA